MTDREKVIKWLECCGTYDENLEHVGCTEECPYYVNASMCDPIAPFQDALALLKEQEPMTPEEFKDGLLKMFSSIWECEIDHPIFQDTIGELMNGVMQLYKEAVKWDD